MKDNSSYNLLAETLARIPKGFGLGSLDRIDFLERNVTKTVAITHIYKANDVEDDHSGIQRIRVYSVLLAKLSKKARIGVIAHELAHVWLTEHSGSEASIKREEEADALARRWGFRPELDALDSETYTVGEYAR